MAATKLPYVPHLDGLRGIAIAGVLLQHFDPTGHISRIDVGLIGVVLFFVLSGYLITRILLAERERGTIAAARSFYWRRLVRLAPAYYLAIILALALGIGGMRQAWPVHALFLTNFQVALTGKWNASSHFWSLAVEEQFYLLWFAAVVIAPRRWLMPIIAMCLVGGPLFRAAMSLRQFNTLTFVLLPGCIDSLAMGALLAIYGDRLRPWFGWATFSIAIAGLLFVSLNYGWGSARKFVLFAIFANIAAACAILMATKLDFLKQARLVHIGKISYGIYVFHFFIPQAVGLVLPIPYGTVTYFVLYSALSLAVAQCSWVLVERRALALKDRYPTRRVEASIPAGTPNSP